MIVITQHTIGKHSSLRSNKLSILQLIIMIEWIWTQHVIKLVIIMVLQVIWFVEFTLAFSVINLNKFVLINFHCKYLKTILTQTNTNNIKMELLLNYRQLQLIIQQKLIKLIPLLLLITHYFKITLICISQRI
jgi:hypothetical protein